MTARATLRLLERFQTAHGALPDVERLTDAVRVVALNTREPAFGEDEPCPRVYIVQSGLLKQLYTREDGTEWIKSFATAGDLFACPVALSGGPTTFASIAIEPSIVEFVEWRVVEGLAEEHLAWQRAIRLGFQALA